MLKQSLQFKLSQKLSPQQIQLMKLIQLPTQAFEQRLQEELVENLSKFCRQHNLNKAAMYEVYHGKRNHHKNFTLKKQGD